MLQLNVIRVRRQLRGRCTLIVDGVRHLMVTSPWTATHLATRQDTKTSSKDVNAYWSWTAFARRFCCALKRRIQRKYSCSQVDLDNRIRLFQKNVHRWPCKRLVQPGMLPMRVNAWWSFRLLRSVSLGHLKMHTRWYWRRWNHHKSKARSCQKHHPSHQVPSKQAILLRLWAITRSSPQRGRLRWSFTEHNKWRANSFTLNHWLIYSSNWMEQKFIHTLLLSAHSARLKSNSRKQETFC